MARAVRASLLLAVLGGALPACKGCQPDLKKATATVRTDQTSVDFGQVPLGAHLALEIVLSNAGRAAVTARVSAQPVVFAPGVTRVDLQGGDTVPVQVTFSPSTLGQIAGTFTLVAADQSLTVQLLGEGVPACAAAAACHRVEFEPTAHACVDSVLSDGTGCAAPCIVGGECRAGACLGSSAACDDQNPCTDDSCSVSLDGGCLHVDKVCPVTSACRTAVCVPDAGCIERPVDDGVACGPADCLSAEVCVNDSCVSRPTPGGQDDCRYTSVAGSSSWMTCATTVSGTLRCWGAWRPPHTVAGSSGAAKVAPLSALGYTAYPGEGVCTVDASGMSVVCSGLASPDGGLGAPVRQLDPPCAVLTDDRYVCWSPLTGDVTTLRTGVASAEVVYGASGPGLGTDVRCFALDAGLDCEARDLTHPWGPVAPAFSSVPDRLVAPSTSNALCGEWGDALRCISAYFDDPPDGGLDLYWLDERDFDAGLLLGGDGQAGPGLFAAGKEVWGEDGALLFTMTDDVLQLTSAGNTEPCLLTDQQEVWCWGEDNYGGLGQLTGNPRGLQQLPLNASAIALTDDSTLLEVSGGLWQLGGTVPWAIPDGGFSLFNRAGTTFLGPVAPGTSLMPSKYYDLCGIGPNQRAWCLGAGIGSTEFRDLWNPFDLGPAVALADLWGPQGLDLGLLQADGTLTLPDGGAQLHDVVEITDGCARLVDGGVLCMSRPDPYAPAVMRPIDLGAVPRQLSAFTLGYLDWCAWLPGDRVVCWQPATDGGFEMPTQISGVASGVRQLVGGLAEGGCVLVGSNLAQCWGPDPIGDGEPSPTVAQPIVFAEAIDSISMGGEFTCALASSGRVYCWGRNTWGQLGFPPLVTSTPVKVTH